MITPEQIDAKEFSVKLRGYDPVEVDEFLDAVIVSYRDVLNRLARALDTVDRLRENGTAVHPVIGDVSKLLSVAQQTADQTVAEANGEAGRIVADAHKERNDIVESGHEARRERITALEARKEDLEHHVDALQKTMDAARQRMATVLAEIGDGPA